MKIRELMTTNVHTIRPDEDLEVARQLMLWCGFRHLPVVDAGRLVGIVSERDILARKAASREALESGHGSHAQTARDAMRTPVETVGPDDDAYAAASLMSGRRIGCLPVVDATGVVGIVTTTDLLGAFGAQGIVPQPGREVGAVMTRDPMRLRPNDTVGNAIAVMLTETVRHLPVVDDEGRVVGIISDRDLRSAIGDPMRSLSRERKAILQTLIAGVMTTPAATIREDAPLDEAVEILVERRIGALPVVDGEQKLVGMLSYVDVLKQRKAPAEGTGDEVQRPHYT